MRSALDVFYVTLPVDNADQAISLAEYLAQHGISAAREGNDAVVCPVEDARVVPVIQQLRVSWLLYWENSDSGLFGLPVLLKDGCVVGDAGCAQCGAGPRVQ